MADNETQGWYNTGRVSSILETYMRAADVLAEVIWKICMAIGVLLVVVIGGQVFTRYLLGWVPLWGGELSRYFAIWIAFLLTPVFVWQDTHLQVEILFRKLSKRRQRIVRSAQLLLIGGVGFFLANWGFVYAVDSGFGQSSPSLDIPMFYPYLGLPLCGVLILFFAGAKIVEINVNPDTLKKDYRDRFLAQEDDD